MLPVTSSWSPRPKVPELRSSAIPAVSSTRQPPPSVKSEPLSATPLIVATVPSGSVRASAIEIGGPGDGVDEGVTDGLGDGLGGSVGPGVAEALGEGVVMGVADGDGDSVMDGETVGDGRTLGDADGEADSVGVADGDGDGDAIGAAAAFCGSGVARATKSALLSSVSCPDPARPPGSRSRLEPAGAAGAGTPSSQVLVAVPQPTASIAVVAPWMRSATLPPVAARPLA